MDYGGTCIRVCTVSRPTDPVGIAFEQPVYIVGENEDNVTVTAMLNVTLEQTRIDVITEFLDVTATS